MPLISAKLAHNGLAAMPAKALVALRASLAASEAENSKVRELLEIADRLRTIDAETVAELQTSEAALASSQEATREGQADLRASEAALASSRAEAQEGQADLLASEVALALSREETKEGRTSLLASAVALALAREQTREGRTDLLASKKALALCRAETKQGQTPRQVSAAANKAKSLADALLVAAETALLRGEERFRRLVEAAPTAMVMINAAGRIQMVNAQTERLFGYSRNELIGASVEILLPVPQRRHHPGFRAAFFDAPSTRRMGAGLDLFALKKDGSEFRVEIGLSPLETEDGPMVLSAVVDITDRVCLESQVRQSQKMQAIGRIAAGVAHDFNNLLQALSGSLEVLCECIADQPEAMGWAEIALNAAGRGKELTDRLLSFSRKQHLVAKPVTVADLFRGLEHLLRPLLETGAAAKTTLVIAPPPSGLTVLADLAQLEAAIINLAVNARDAMISGGNLRLSAYGSDADPALVAAGHYTIISVADTGCGMTADILAQACDPFFSTKGLYGTGLGLSMVKGFAQQSGGDAHIASVPGQGTTIDLWLPSAGQPQAAKKSARSPPVAVTGKVLLVDDSEDALIVTAAFLRLGGLEVTSRSSGDLALSDLMAGHRFDIIITDFTMPGMNGVELLERAREIDAAMATMIITGFSDPEMLSDIRGVEVLHKPFTRLEMTERVQKIMAARQALLNQHAKIAATRRLEPSVPLRHQALAQPAD